MLSPTLIDKLLKSCLACGDLKTMNSVLESLIFSSFFFFRKKLPFNYLLRVKNRTFQSFYAKRLKKAYF